MYGRPAVNPTVIYHPYISLASSALPFPFLPILPILVLLPTPQHLQMPRLARKQLLRLADQSRGMLLFYFGLRNKRCFFGLDDARAAFGEIAGGPVCCG
jgi:hypothetical protein